MELACQAAKKAASFSGMRGNLVAMLDHFGISGWLGIDSCRRLFNGSNAMLQATSMLRYPVFVAKSNYNGFPTALKSRFLRRYVLDYFANEAKQLHSALFIPLGSKVAEVLEWLAAEGVIENERILSGLPHPSGANNERVKYILGKKTKSELSVKTNARRLDEARASIQTKVAALGPL